MTNCNAGDVIRIESLAEGRAVTTVGYNWLEAYDLWKHGQAEAVKLRARVAELEAALRAAVTEIPSGADLAAEWGHSTEYRVCECSACRRVRRHREIREAAESLLKRD